MTIYWRLIMKHIITAFCFILFFGANLPAHAMNLNISSSDWVAGSYSINRPCGNGSFATGTSITFTGIPNSGYIFKSWVGCGVNSSTNPTTVSMPSSDCSMVVSFDVPPPTAKTITPSISNGTVSPTSQTVDAQGNPPSSLHIRLFNEYELLHHWYYQ